MYVLRGGSSPLGDAEGVNRRTHHLLGSEVQICRPPHHVGTGRGAVLGEDVSPTSGPAQIQIQRDTYFIIDTDNSL